MNKFSKKVSFPDESILGPIREKLSDPSYQGGNLALPENATEVDRTKYQICQMIVKYQQEHRMTQRELARSLKIDESRISDIFRGKIEGFTLDRLLDYASKLHPNLKVVVSAA
jgi:predicted XRE-type DNA-binding protein